MRALITRRQGWLFFPLLTLEGLNLHYLGFKHLASAAGQGPLDRTCRSSRCASRSTSRRSSCSCRSAWRLPSSACSSPSSACTWARRSRRTTRACRSSTPDAKLDFFTKQVRTSRNVSGGWWATWLMGGLNYQIEHHLFPSMPRIHLAQAREIVKDHCEALDVPYTETTLIESYGIVIRYLNQVGLAARDPFDCGIVQKFRAKGI